MNVETRLVLIDDDEIIRKTWELVARRKGHLLQTFASVADFLGERVDFNVPLYVDYRLDGEDGS